MVSALLFLAVMAVACYAAVRVYRAAPSRATTPARPASPRVTVRGADGEMDADMADAEEALGADAWIDGDAWEGTFTDTTHRFDLPVTLQLRYRDGNGAASERLVTVRAAGQLGTRWLLIGHCHLGNATRSFRVDRIIEAVDQATGEVLEAPAAWVAARYQASPEAARDRLVEDAADLLRVLYFIGKADGQLRAPEKRVIADCLGAFVGDPRLTPELAHDAMDLVGLPSLSGFKQAVGRLSAQPPDCRARIVAAAESIVATQKTVHPAEADALAYLRARCAPASASAQQTTER